MSKPIGKNDELTRPLSPSRLKTTELGRINPAYTDVRNINASTLVPGVPYLWTLNESGQVLIGIEKPWEHPEAFHVDVTNEVDLQRWNMIVQQLQSATESESHEGFGHPTLGASFTETGEADVGAAYLGGELHFDVARNHWILDNRSGRYGRTRETEPQAIIQIQRTLEHVAKLFQAQGISIEPRLVLKESEKGLQVTQKYKEELCKIIPTITDRDDPADVEELTRQRNEH